MTEIYKKILLAKIPFELKGEALEDLSIMENNRLYAERVCYDRDEKILFNSFIFSKSFLGFDFWMQINSMIYEKI